VIFFPPSSQISVTFTPVTFLLTWFLHSLSILIGEYAREATNIIPDKLKLNKIRQLYQQVIVISPPTITTYTYYQQISPIKIHRIVIPTCFGN
jgi:hypothetical protein